MAGPHVGKRPNPMSNRLIVIVWCLLTIFGNADDQKKSDPLVGTVDATGPTSKDAPR